jgi:universal stress protein A
MKLRKILVPVDYSACSRAALAFAASFAETAGAELDVIHVWDRPPYVPESTMVRHPDGTSRSLVDMIREGAEREMAEFAASVELPAAVRFEPRLLSGNPARAILDELARGTHDLVIVGTHGRTGLRHVLLGSVAEKLVRLAPVPVLTVPAPAPSPAP